jgi:hypothetical protein
MPLLTPCLNSGPFPPPELPGLTGTTNPSAIPAGPACPSRASGCGPLPRTDWGFPCCLGSPLRACCRQYPGGTAGPCRSRGGCLTPSEIQRRRPSPEVWRVGSHITAFGACSAFTTRYGLPARGATLWPFASKAPATSLPPPPLRLLPAGTTSCRVGIAPTEDPRLITAHILQACHLPVALTYLSPRPSRSTCAAESRGMDDPASGWRPCFVKASARPRREATSSPTGSCIYRRSDGEWASSMADRKWPSASG